MWLKSVRYLDYNAGSGISDLVKQKLISFLTDEAEVGLILANPSSKHRLGQRVTHHLYQAKLSIAKSLNCKEDELFFTSSGTEANQTVIRSVVSSSLNVGAILGAGEHSATLDLLPQFQPQTQFARVLPLLASGEYDLPALHILLNEAFQNKIHTVFLSLAWANNETGVILDLTALKNVIAQSPATVILHLDAAQAWGKIPVNLSETFADYVTFTGHKIGAPAGVGVIFKKQNAPLKPLILGTQQQGSRGGTENSLGIITLGMAASLVDPAHFIAQTEKLRDRLESQLLAKSSKIKIWARETNRLSNTSRIGFKGFQKYENWVELLDVRGFAVSHGSACKSQLTEPSRVLLAMGASRDEALNSIRISLGPHNTIEDIDQFVDTLLNMNQLKEAPKEAIDEA